MKLIGGKKMLLEYKVLIVDIRTIQEDINSLTKDGWKVLCSCGKRGDLILKRKLSIEE